MESGWPLGLVESVGKAEAEGEAQQAITPDTQLFTLETREKEISFRPRRGLTVKQQNSRSLADGSPTTIIY